MPVRRRWIASRHRLGYAAVICKLDICKSVCLCYFAKRTSGHEMIKQVRVNIRTAVNAAKIRTEKRNGRDVMVIPSATLPDGVVMNGIRYPAAAIDASYQTLDRTLAPLGHPKASDGSFLSAKDPEAINRHHIGAWNENVRREGGRVLVDKVIDLELANATEGGKRVLAALKKGDPIHTSTGLLATLKPLENDADAAYEVEDMVFDHDAILLDEPGAATPEQGVGMLVNGQQIEVINSDLEERADEQLDWAVESLMRAVEQRAKVPMLKRIKDTLLQLVGAGDGETESGEETEKEAPMAFTPEEAAAMKEQIANMQTAIDKLTGADVSKKMDEMTNALTAINERFAAEDAAKTAAADAEKAAMAEKVANAGLMTADEAKAAPIEALRVLANTITAPTAAPIMGHFINRKAPADLASLFPSEA